MSNDPFKIPTWPVSPGAHPVTLARGKYRVFVALAGVVYCVSTRARQTSLASGSVHDSDRRAWACLAGVPITKVREMCRKEREREAAEYAKDELAQHREALEAAGYRVTKRRKV